MTRLLITGGCGFIGSNLVEFILEKTSWKINILDNLSNGSIENVQNLNNFNERVKFFKGDITNISDISKSLDDCEYIVNLAAQTSVINSINNPFKDESINIKGIINLLKLGVEKKVKKFIQASSAAAVGNQKMPMNEIKIPKPISPYGASKLAGEAYCNAFTEIFGISCIVLRFSNVYGPKSNKKSSVIAQFLKQILNGEELIVYGDGIQTRDFIYVKDICKGIYLSLIKHISGSEIYQIGTGIETSINSLIEKISKIMVNKSISIPNLKYVEERQGEILRNFSDITKAKRDLGFSIDYNLEKGLKNTIKWFLNNEI